MKFLNKIFGKEEIIKEETKEKHKETKKHEFKETTETLFRMIEITNGKDEIFGKLNDYGESRLDKMNIKELIDFFITFNDAHNIEAELNIYGMGSVTSARKFLAYKILASQCMFRIKNIYNLSEVADPCASECS